MNFRALLRDAAIVGVVFLLTILITYAVLRATGQTAADVGPSTGVYEEVDTSGVPLDAVDEPHRFESRFESTSPESEEVYFGKAGGAINGAD